MNKNTGRPASSYRGARRNAGARAGGGRKARKTPAINRMPYIEPLPERRKRKYDTSTVGNVRLRLFRP